MVYSFHQLMESPKDFAFCWTLEYQINLRCADNKTKEKIALEMGRRVLKEYKGSNSALTEIKRHIC